LVTDSGLIVPQPWKYQYPSLNKFHTSVSRRRSNVRIALALCEHLDFWSRAASLSQKLAVHQIHLKRLEYIARLYADYTRLPVCFETDNTRQLFRSLQSADQRDFFFDPTVIEWPKYIREIHLPGVRRHVVERSC
jgi:fatty acyl-CoA reductase